ncbi:MAG TPA: hypothetical protein PK079_23905 [Leptospiraceae bacterium]|nr:hypothetical protein [Leptospiraceae bacterium]HNC59784.1 hypothetical protein [Leptospiraceae bacterium]HNE56229.1 hypothetical protein [Leptospiraceae bacterium]HNF57567.1 hypothetical protein [Leptospiraceae bacterium]HNM92127.1 hypothetical protein [Leptospiraceae bacterium]
MDRVFNKVQNKTEYFFLDREVKEIAKRIIQKKFLWTVRDYIFSTQYKSVFLEIRVKTQTLLIYNDKEVAKVILDKETYLELVLGIQEFVTQG